MKFASIRSMTHCLPLKWSLAYSATDQEKVVGVYVTCSGAVRESVLRACVHVHVRCLFCGKFMLVCVGSGSTIVDPSMEYSSNFLFISREDMIKHLGGEGILDADVRSQFKALSEFLVAEQVMEQGKKPTFGVHLSWTWQK